MLFYNMGNDKERMQSTMKTLIAYFSRKGNNYVGGSIVNLPVGNTAVAAEYIKKQRAVTCLRLKRKRLTRKII